MFLIDAKKKNIKYAGICTVKIDTIFPKLKLILCKIWSNVLDKYSLFERKQNQSKEQKMKHINWIKKIIMSHKYVLKKKMKVNFFKNIYTDQKKKK